MLLFPLLQMMNPAIAPGNSKIHLAISNGIEDPLAVYFDGGFNAWQCLQSRRNFERTHVVSLIRMHGGEDRWLFAGVYRSGLPAAQPGKSEWIYPLEELPECTEMNGRIVVRFRRSSRQSYLLAENCAGSLVLDAILPERLSIGEFPGFKAVNLDKSELDLIVRHEVESWRAALSSVAGVYLISDGVSGRLYVGSAIGEGGIWQRWQSYASTGHGGNVELVRLLAEAGADRAKGFRYSILEIADTHASGNDILRRESHWKEVLLTRQFGLNAN